jgi:hypothetical protein
MTLYIEALNAGPLRGPLYKGEANLCRDRREFWKLQFSKVKDEVDEEASKMAQRAIGAMERVGKVKGSMIWTLSSRFKKPRTE